MVNGVAELRYEFGNAVPNVGGSGFLKVSQHWGGGGEGTCNLRLMWIREEPCPTGVSKLPLL